MQLTKIEIKNYISNNFEVENIDEKYYMILENLKNAIETSFPYDGAQ